MTSETQHPPRHVLEIRLRNENVPVSYLSSLLRVVQAALREVARNVDGPSRRFEQSPQPVLVLSRLDAGGELALRFTFVDPLDDTALEDLSYETFDALLSRFAEFVRGLPQPGLWGGAAPRRPPSPLESDLAKRMDQLHREMRRSPKAVLTHSGRSIAVEGDLMEFS